MHIVIDPEFEYLIPPLADEEFSKLEQDVIENGIRDSIKVWKDKGVLIDGHNRYKLAQKHGLGYEVDEIEFSSKEEVIWWIVNNQAGRRNLTKTQQALMYADADCLVAGLKAKAKENQRIKQRGDMTHVNKILAEMAGVGHATMDRVMAVKKSGNQELYEKMKSGDITAKKAYGIIQREKKAEDSRQPASDCSGCGDDSFIKLATSKIGTKNRWTTNDVRKLLKDPPMSERSPCYICGGHAGITELHHVVHISELTHLLNVGLIGPTEVSTPTVWLCPNCHTYVHAAVDGDDDAVAQMMQGDDTWACFRLVIKARTDHLEKILETADRRTKEEAVAG